MENNIHAIKTFAGNIKIETAEKSSKSTNKKTVKCYRM